MRLLACIVAVVLVFLASLPLEAQIPRTNSFQGILTDTLGNPKADGLYSFRFRLYDASSGGSVVWEETKDVEVKRGLFHTILGDQSAIGPTVTFDKAYWLGVQVGGEPESTPLIPLSSAGYSFSSIKAEMASTVEDGAVTTNKLFDKAVTTSKIAASAVTPVHISSAGAGAGEVLTYNGSNVVWSTPSGGIGGSGTADYITRFTGPSTLGNSAIYQDGGLIAIGTTSPVFPFTVESALVNNINPIIEIRRSGANSAAPLRFTRSTGEHFNIGITKYNGFAISGMNSNIGLAGDVFTVSDSGRVGILTRSPHVDLHIKQSMSVINGVRGGLRLEATSSSDYWQIHHSAIHCSFTENGTRRAYVEGGTGDWTISSDRALKKNIEPLGSILERVLQLRAVNFHYADSDESRPKSQGFIAQEVEEVFPEVVKTDEAGGKGLAYANFSVLAIKAIQEQQEVIDQLRSEIDQLKARLK